MTNPLVRVGDDVQQKPADKLFGAYHHQFGFVTTARSVNTGMTWNENRTSLSNWGSAPTVIEPVKGKVILRNLEPAKAIVVIPLNGAGEASSNTSSTQNIKAGLEVSIGEPATTWYLARIER